MSRNKFHMAFAALCIASACLRPALALYDQGGFLALLGGTFGTDPVVWAAIFLGFWALARGDDSPITFWDRAAVVASAALLLLPIAIASWAAICVVMLRAAICASGKPHIAGYAILAAVGLREPLTAIGLKLFAGPVLAFDATLAVWLLSAFISDTAIYGNIVEGVAGHRLFIMTGCASYTNLSFAFLAWFAVIRFRRVEIDRQIVLQGTCLASAVLAVNIARLALMAISREHYVYFHDGAGATLISGLTVLAVATTVFWSCRNARPV